jgi:hypothetical protein
MSHDVSRGKQDEIERSRRLAELRPFVVPGWRIHTDRFQIVEIKTVLGYYQRGQTMLLRCRRLDCRRRVEIDFEAAVHAGHGAKPLPFLLQMLRCHHWSGCQREEMSATYPKGVPLVGLLQHKDVLVAIACAACPARLLLPPREVIRKLSEARRGDGSTGVLELGKAVRGPCRKCDGRRFESELIWPRCLGSQGKIAQRQMKPQGHAGLAPLPSGSIPDLDEN